MSVDTAERYTLAAGALTTELRLPTAMHLSNSTPALRVIDNPIPKLVVEESSRTIKSTSTEHQYVHMSQYNVV